MTLFTINRSHPLATTSRSSMDYAGTASAKQMNGMSHHHRHMWIITGPAGCGKSTTAQYLAKELSIPYIEGDDVCRTPLFYLWPTLLTHNQPEIVPL